MSRIANDYIQEQIPDYAALCYGKPQAFFIYKALIRLIKL